MAKDIVIAIAGEIGSGKDHVMGLIAGYAAREGKPRYNTVSSIRFADPIKRGIAAMVDLPLDFLYYEPNKSLISIFDYKKDDYYVDATYGELQQVFGDLIRSIDVDIFCKILINKVNFCKHLVIIPDLRFDNELDYLLETLEDKRLILIKLIGVYDDKKNDKRDRNHISEVNVRQLNIQKFDYILNVNTYVEEEMKNVIKQILIKEGIL